MGDMIDRTRALYKRFPGFRRLFWRTWYQYFSGKYLEGDVVFMNYGYAPLDSGNSPLPLEKEDERERVCVQLYDHVVRLAITESQPLGEKQFLEVGSGRGGGASYVARYLQPRSMLGVDFSKNNIAFCRRRHHAHNLSFRVGDAENLPLEDGAVDAVVNVESSHCYGSIPRFFAEVRRVLREGGYFYYADLRDEKEIPELAKTIRDTPFQVEKQERITANVLRALELDHARREGIIDRAAPKFLRNPIREFSGLRGSKIYNALNGGGTEYIHYVLRKI